MANQVGPDDSNVSDWLRSKEVECGITIDFYLLLLLAVLKIDRTVNRWAAFYCIPRLLGYGLLSDFAPRCICSC